MAKVTVTPETFELIDFDAAEIAAIAAEVADAVGIGAAVPLVVEVDEAIMMGRAAARIEDGKVLVSATGGAFESLRKARAFDPERGKAILGHVMLRASDRLDPSFGDPPPDDEIDVLVDSAWAAYIEGRLDRRGIVSGRPQRRMYHFRVRHGFNDDVDRVFDRLWNADGLTWDDVKAASSEAAAAGQSVLA